MRRLILVAVALIPLSPGRALTQPIWAVGEPSDLQFALQALGQDGFRRGRLDGLPRGRARTSGLALCSFADPEPTRLSSACADAVERFVAEGGMWSNTWAGHGAVGVATVWGRAGELPDGAG